METIFHLIFYSILWNPSLLAAKHDICAIKTFGGYSKNVCCADFEEINSECKPCLTGYISNIGQKCRPCAPNTFGKVCLEDCDCNAFERCDNVVGCVESRTTESFVEAEQTSRYTESDLARIAEVSTTSKMKTTVDVYDLQTTSWLMKVTSRDSNKSSGLSSREKIVYYTLSVVVLILLILLICLCLVIIKHKREKRGRSNISNSVRESRNQTVENNDQSGIEEYNVYDEIDDTDINDIEFKPQPKHNDYLEVVDESKSSNSSDSGKPERNSYLNPYHPCFSTEDTRSSYERLHMQTIETRCDNEKTNTYLQDQDGCMGINVSTLPSSYDIEVKPLFHDNDYLEVVDDSKSSYSSDSGTPERNGLCTSTEDIKSAHERLQIKTMKTKCDNEKAVNDLQDKDGCMGINLSTLISSSDYKPDGIGTIQSDTHISHKCNQKEFPKCTMRSTESE